MSEDKPRVDSIVIRTTYRKRRRQYGDRKVIKGVEHVCRHVYTNGAMVVLNGRPQLQWVPVDKDPEKDWR